MASREPLLTALEWLSSKGVKVLEKICKYLLVKNNVLTEIRPQTWRTLRIGKIEVPSEDDLMTLGGIAQICYLYRFSSLNHILKRPLREYTNNKISFAVVNWYFRYSTLNKAVSVLYNIVNHFDNCDLAYDYLSKFVFNPYNSVIDKENRWRDLCYVVGEYNLDLPEQIFYVNEIVPISVARDMFPIYGKTVSKSIKFLVDVYSGKIQLNIYNIDKAFDFLLRNRKRQIEALLKIDYLPRELKMMIAMNLILYKIDDNFGKRRCFSKQIRWKI